MIGPEGTPSDDDDDDDDDDDNDDDNDDDDVNDDDRDRAELHRERHHRDGLLPPGDPGDAGEYLILADMIHLYYDRWGRWRT